MLTTNKYIIGNAKCMPLLSRVSILLSVGFFLEFASFACFAEAVPVNLAPDSLSDSGYDNIKRAGFVGMRGKKSDPEDEQYYFLNYWNPSWPDMLENGKRAGFVGMRGKKSHGNSYFLHPDLT